MLHPVGPLRPAVYWRRRLLVLVLLAALGAGGWAGTELATGRLQLPGAAGVASTRPASVVEPALTRVAPSVVAVRSPDAPAPCTDAMLELVLHAVPSVPSGGGATFQLLVTDVGPVPCVRSLGAAARELVLANRGGARIWSSADCPVPGGADDRTLTPGVPVSLPVTWDGRASAPGCPTTRATPPPGGYLLQGRLATRTAPPTPLTLVP